MRSRTALLLSDRNGSIAVIRVVMFGPVILSVLDLLAELDLQELSTRRHGEHGV
jgi:hypothetical protein